MSKSSEEDMAFKAAGFEVFGRVQGVFFRKYTKEQADKLQVVGWIRNTERDTVEGEIQGSPSSMNEMKEWLRKTGSPQSRIEKAVFKDEQDVDSLNFTEFKIRR